MTGTRTGRSSNTQPGAPGKLLAVIHAPFCNQPPKSSNCYYAQPVSCRARRSSTRSRYPPKPSITIVGKRRHPLKVWYDDRAGCDPYNSGGRSPIYSRCGCRHTAQCQQYTAGSGVRWRRPINSATSPALVTCQIILLLRLLRGHVIAWRIATLGWFAPRHGLATLGHLAARWSHTTRSPNISKQRDHA